VQCTFTLSEITITTLSLTISIKGFPILNFFKKPENRLLFIFRDMNTIRDDVKYDLILTPQHYIIKKSELELKYSFQAKNIAPSMLDELSTECRFEL